MTIDASGKGYAGKDFFRALFIKYLDVRTYYALRDTGDLLWANLKAESQASLDQCLVAVMDAMIGDFHDFNTIAGTFIQSRQELNAYIRRLKGLGKGGRPTGTGRSTKSVISWLKPYVDMCEGKDPPLYPSLKIVAGFVDYHENSIRYHVRKHWSSWEKFLAECKATHPP